MTEFEDPTALQSEIASAKAQLLADGTYERLVNGIKQLLGGDTATLTHALIKDELSRLPRSSQVKIHEVIEPSTEACKSKKTLPLFRESHENSPITAVPNLLQNQRYFAAGGYGLNAQETTHIYYAVKKFLETQKNIGHCRFWGKIMGLDANYYIIECTELEIPHPPMPDEDDVETASVSSVPKSTHQPSPTIPNEFKAGPNRHIYFATTCLDSSGFTQLPDVSPAQILASRSVVKFFTGCLDAEVNSYPNFPGNESNLLRAQIARISATTVVAPTGYMRSDGEEEEDESEDFQGNAPARDLVVSEEVDKLSARALLDLESWQHVRQALSQQQARTRYWKPPKTDKYGGEEEEEEDLEEEDEEPQEMEDIPPILREITSDGKNMEEEETDGLTGKEHWSSKMSSKLGKHPIAYAVSNIWPGAVTFATGDLFESLYIGWGAKFVVENYSPDALPVFETEADLVEHAKDCAEMTDPTVEEETQLRERLQAGDEAEDDEDEESEEGEDEEY